MLNKTTMTLWLITAILMSYCPLFAQQGDKLKEGGRISGPTEPMRVPTEEELTQRLDNILSRGDNSLTLEGLSMFMTQFVKYSTALGYNKLVQKIMDIAEFESFNRQYPDQAYKFSSLRLRMLTHFKDYPGVREFVLKSLEGPIPHIQAEAAAALLFWDEWDLAAPILCKYEAYNLFQIHKDQRGIPLLEKATRNASWQGRILAAAALFYTYGDSSKYPQVALDIILNAPINTDDENTNRAKFLALDQVARFDLTQALPGLIRMAQDTARGIAPKAVGLLVDLSGMGYSEAHQALVDIEKNHANANIREIARHGLLKLEEEQKQK